MQETPKKTVTVISPFAKPSLWFPEPHQIIDYPNESRLNSAWLGLVAPFVMLPGRIWNEVLRPALRGHVLFAIKHLLLIIPATWLIWILDGLAGTAYAVKATPEQMKGAFYLDPPQSMIATLHGQEQVCEKASGERA
jgi:hypothetical protein